MTRAIVPPAHVAVIGLGNMGFPMASRLVKAGYRVTGFDQSRTIRDRFALEASGIASDSVEQAVASAEVIITMLPNSQVVCSVMESIRPHLRPEAILLEMSSSEPTITRDLGAGLIAEGFGFIDAPVSGGVKRAVDGSLAIMIGGKDETIDRIEPLLKELGRSFFRTGPVGSGHAAKALNNYVSGAGLVAALEAVHAARAFGIDPDLMVDVLNASSGRNNSTETKLKQFVLSETYGSGFFLGLMAKDIRCAQHLGQQLGVRMPLGDACADIWDAAAERLDKMADHTEIGRFLDGE
jgi:3-hydroxyisobutyrate dehydrogenase